MGIGMRPGQWRRMARSRGRIALAASTIRTATLTRAKTAAAAVRNSTGNMRVMILGDSNVAGAGSGTGGSFLYTNAFKRGFVQRLSSPSYPLSFGSVVGGNKVSPQSTYPAYDPRMVMSGGSIMFASNQLGGDSFSGTNGQTGTYVFTPDAPFDRVEIIYLKNPGNASAVVKADGITLTSLVGNGTLATVSTGELSCALSASLTIEVGTASLSFVTCGIITWNSTVPSIIVLQAGWAGGTIAQAGATTNAYASANQIDDFRPDLVIVNGLTINDASANTTAANWQTRMESLVTSITASGASVAWASGLNLGLADAPSPANDLLLNERLRTVCANQNISLLEMHDFWSPVADYEANYYAFDHRHYSYDGGTVYAYQFSRFLESLLVA
jgi:lysophospholipase L1-like esterase